MENKNQYHLELIVNESFQELLIIDLNHIESTLITLPYTSIECKLVLFVHPNSPLSVTHVHQLLTRLSELLKQELIWDLEEQKELSDTIGQLYIIKNKE